MKDFTYQMPVKVYFGEGSVKKYLAGVLEEFGPNIMLAYGKGSIKRTGIYDDVMSILKENHKNVIDFPNIPANPTYQKVLEGIRLYKEHDVDLILAVGGGSVVDCCKIITAGAHTDEDIWELEVEKHIIPKKMGKFAVILTLSGAGAEMDCLGAATNEAKHEKRTLTGSFAEFVIMDPTYLMRVPLELFMPGVYDSLSHCMETYFGKTTNVSDRMNESLMHDIVMNMKALIRGEDTLEIRSNLMWDASLIQTFLFQIGKSGDFQAHSIENMLGAFSHGTHGKQLAVLQPVYYRTIYSSDIEKFARFARTVVDVKSEDDNEAALLGLDALEALIRDAGLKTSFHELGFDLTHEIAKEVSQKCGISRGGVRQLSREEIYDILMRCK